MKALGIVNFEDSTASIDGLGDFRPVPAISFMGRYRIIDFILSNFTNSGIDHVQVYCKEKPRNLIEHLGSGSYYNINSKRGSLQILYGEKPFSSPVYNNDVANFLLNMQYIEADPNPYVILAPSYFVYSLDFNDVLDEHISSGADVTVLYTATRDAKSKFLGCDVLTVDKDKRITAFGKNHGNFKTRNISMEAYVMTKKMFISLCNKAADASSLYWFKDILADLCGTMNFRGYNVHTPVICLNSLEEYYQASMRLRDYDAAGDLFRPEWPIYTQTNDSCPTRIAETAVVRESAIADGCVIKGTVDGCILGRNVTVKEGAVVRDSIILANVVIGEDTHLDHAIVDKYATVERVRRLEGTDAEPIYVRRRDRI
ncbi:MAG: glucose-1-phosphate adenylyltransferase subunit GlgD [Solobacterium sp.]|nr:glucose-1-phosphate adenylyltransferase subunit GlgD [Solobacterium sp.]